MKIFITGIHGFIGTNLSRYLREVGHDIVPRSRWTGWQSEYDDEATVDVADYEELSEAVFETSPDLIIHLAARKGSDYVDQDVESAIRSNVTGMKNVIKVANESQTPLIHFGTTAYYHSDASTRSINEYSLMAPKTTYGITKMLQLHLLEAQCVGKYMTIEPVFLYGNIGTFAANRSESIPDLLVKLLNDKDFPSCDARIDPQWIKDYTHISDFVWLMQRIIEKPAWGSRITVGAMHNQRFIDVSRDEIIAVDGRLRFLLDVDYKQNQRHDYRKLLRFYPEWEARERITLTEYYKFRGNVGVNL